MARRVRAARGHLARLVVVLAVLAGLGLAISLQCTDGMAMPMAHTTTACDSPLGMAAEHAAAGADRLTSVCGSVVALADQDALGTNGLGGVLATCLVFLIGVVVAIAVLRPGPVRCVAPVLRSARLAVRRAVRPRAPSLAELCLLRT